MKPRKATLTALAALALAIAPAATAAASTQTLTLTVPVASCAPDAWLQITTPDGQGRHTLNGDTLTITSDWTPSAEPQHFTVQTNKPVDGCHITGPGTMTLNGDHAGPYVQALAPGGANLHATWEPNPDVAPEPEPAITFDHTATCSTFTFEAHLNVDSATPGTYEVTAQAYDSETITPTGDEHIDTGDYEWGDYIKVEIPENTDYLLWSYRIDATQNGKGLVHYGERQLDCRPTTTDPEPEPEPQPEPEPGDTETDDETPEVDDEDETPATEETPAIDDNNPDSDVTPATDNGTDPTPTPDTDDEDDTTPAPARTDTQAATPIRANPRTVG